ncbi:MAG: CvpA family protein [Gammaproteobacteria bacterium]
MNQIDVAILIVTALSCLFGLWRGLIKEVLSLLTWVAALVIARVYSEALSGSMTGFIDNDSVRYVTAFVLLFMVVMMLGTGITHLLKKLLTVTGLRLADRVLGGAFGILRGVVIVLVIVFITRVFVSETEIWRQSSLIPYSIAMIEWSQQMLGEGQYATPAPQLPVY